MHWTELTVAQAAPQLTTTSMVVPGGSRSDGCGDIETTSEAAALAGSAGVPSSSTARTLNPRLSRSATALAKFVGAGVAVLVASFPGDALCEGLDPVITGVTRSGSTRARSALETASTATTPIATATRAAAAEARVNLLDLSVPSLT